MLYPASIWTTRGARTQLASWLAAFQRRSKRASRSSRPPRASPLCAITRDDRLDFIGRIRGVRPTAPQDAPSRPLPRLQRADAIGGGPAPGSENQGPSASSRAGGAAEAKKETAPRWAGRLRDPVIEGDSPGRSGISLPSNPPVFHPRPLVPRHGQVTLVPKAPSTASRSSVLTAPSQVVSPGKSPGAPV